MKHSIQKGFSFGLSSGIITTLGLIVGLYSGTGSKMVVIGGIITIAIADAFSDALGIHLSEEAEAVHTEREIWEATISTFVVKFCFAMIFVIPIILMEMLPAVFVSVAFGLLVLGVFSYYIAKKDKTNPVNVISEHLLIAVIVVIVTYYVGIWVSKVFK
ncbi:MAG: hypothetical protein PHY73_00205 [Candidatus Omnitrophica bacterium]|nr:hypothetical protein [Candidatus Omnitrophota bacterium]